ncbi:MAG: hypothetical protein K9I25_07215 [Crocinitomicaceae bacterium]|jgi:hypothetical protein|nr:hypothetical protein [Crocinitomicaceae bacterium]
MKKTFMFIGFLGASITAFSQVQLTQVHLSSGSYRQFGFTPSNITDFAPLAPGSSILMKDFSNYESGMGYYAFNYPFNMGMQNNASFQSLQVGLSLPKCQGTLRLGISNFSNQLMSAYGSYYESHVVDTLISSQNGSMAFVDSTISRNVFGNYTNEQIRLEAAYVWEMNAGERWAFSAGAGLSFGLSYQSRTTLHFTEYTNSYAGYGSYEGNQTTTHESEVYKNPMNWGANLYVPLGINLRLGTKRAFWKPWMIYSELRPQLSINSIPNAGVKFSPGIGSASGIRYNIPSSNKKSHADF